MDYYQMHLHSFTNHLGLVIQNWKKKNSNSKSCFHSQHSIISPASTIASQQLFTFIWEESYYHLRYYSQTPLVRYIAMSPFYFYLISSFTDLPTTS